MIMAEIRKDERVRAFLRARIIFNNQNTSIECTIKNISASGAKIELSNALSIPSEFDLEVPQKSRVFRARMMWRDANAIGVTFIEDVPEAKNNHSRTELLIEKLEGENRKLKLTVAALKKRLEDIGQDVSFEN